METYPKILIPEGIQEALKYQPSKNEAGEIWEKESKNELSSLSPFIGSLYRYHVRKSEDSYEELFGLKPNWSKIQYLSSTPYPPYYNPPSPPLELARPSAPNSVRNKIAQYLSIASAPIKPTKSKQYSQHIKPPVHSYSKHEDFKFLHFTSELYIYIVFYIPILCLFLTLGKAVSNPPEIIARIGISFVASIILYIPSRMTLLNYIIKIVANIIFERDLKRYKKEILKEEVKAEIEYESKVREYEVKKKDYDERNKPVEEERKRYEEEKKKFEERIKEYYANKKTKQEYINEHFNKFPEQQNAYKEYLKVCDENKKIGEEIGTTINYLYEKIDSYLNQLYDKGYGYKEIRLPRIINALSKSENFEYHTVDVLKGKSEESFKKILQSFFGGHIVSGVTLNNIYYPDILYYDSQFNLMIDIEIDEPYEMEGKRPVHLIGDDNERDIYFLSKNWIVIRFSEKQITLCPNACVKLLSELIQLLTYESGFVRKFDELELPKESIIIDDHWTFEEANYMGINNFRNHYDASNNIKLETQDLLSNIRGKEHLFETDSYVDLIKTELNSFDRNIQKSVKNLMEQFQDSFSLWLNYLNICAGGNDGYIAIMYAGVISHTGIIRRSGNSKMYLELFRRKYVTLIAESVKSGTTHEGFTWNAITTMIYGEKEGLDSLIGRTILIGDMWPMSRLQSAGSTFKLLPWRLEVIHSDENSIILRNPQ